MRIRLYRPPLLFRVAFPGALFRVRTRDKVLFLTFDDGPDRESTPRILEILEGHGVKAAFFCNGERAEKYPEMVALIVSRGHLTGNHGYRHLSGWSTSTPLYIENVSEMADSFSTTTFRPPYGHITPGQYKILKKSLKIVFWDILGYDFDKDLPPDRCRKAILKRIRPGSVIVMHDKKGSSAPAFLDRFLDNAVEEGYRFGLLPLSGQE
ncbi:MAG: polysaccharide deacetylase family protein [Bacteroidales bacterium]